MRVAVLIGALAIVVISVLALVGIDSDEDDSAVLAPPPETADPLPELPPGWRAEENDAIGVALGVPPAWTSKSGKVQTILRSPGSSAVVSVTADRSPDVLGADLDDYALEVAAQIEGADAAKAKAPKPGLGYEAAAARSAATEVIVVRRPELAAYPVLVASGAKVKARELDPIVAEIVASLRGRPANAG